MPTPSPDRAEQNHSVLAMCATVGCKNHSRTWRVFYMKIMPGLLAMGNIICAECHEPVVMTECDHSD